MKLNPNATASDILDAIVIVRDLAEDLEFGTSAMKAALKTLDLLFEAHTKAKAKEAERG